MHNNKKTEIKSRRTPFGRWDQKAGMGQRINPHSFDTFPWVPSEPYFLFCHLCQTKGYKSPTRKSISKLNRETGQVNCQMMQTKGEQGNSSYSQSQSSNCQVRGVVGEYNTLYPNRAEHQWTKALASKRGRELLVPKCHEASKRKKGHSEDLREIRNLKTNKAKLKPNYPENLLVIWL